METPAPLVNGVVNSALFHFSSHISQILHIIIHILSFCPACLVDSLLNYASDFVVNWNDQVRAARRPQIWNFTGATTVC